MLPVYQRSGIGRQAGVKSSVANILVAEAHDLWKAEQMPLGLMLTDSLTPYSDG
jgi:hypothetical protein